MKIKAQQSTNNFKQGSIALKNDEIQDFELSDQIPNQIRQNKINPQCLAILTFLVIFVSIYLYNHQKQQNKQKVLFNQKLQLQSKILEQVRNQLNKQLVKANTELKKQKFQNTNLLLEMNLIKSEIIQKQIAMSQQFNRLKSDLSIKQQKTNQLINQLKIKLQNSQPIMPPDFPQDIINPQVMLKRNFKQPFDYDFSDFYCLKKPLSHINRQVVNQTQFVINKYYGFKCYIRGQDYYNIENTQKQVQVFNQKIFSPVKIQIMGLLLRPGYKLIIIGSSIGLEDIVSAKVIGDTGQIFLFQPNYLNIQIIKKNLQLNNLSQKVILYKLQPFDIKKKSIQNNIQNQQQLNTLQSKNKQVQSKQKIQTQQQIQLEFIDNILPQKQQIDLILINMPNYQIQTLENLKQVIQRSRFLIIMIDSWTNRLDQKQILQKALDLLNFFTQHGYTFYTYHDFKPEQCTIGGYNKIGDPLNDLFESMQQNLLIVPSTVSLP